MEFTEKQISAVARVLSDRSAYDCGVHKDDNWQVYGEDYLESAKAALAVLSAAAPQVVADEREAFVAHQRRADNIPEFITDDVIMAGEITNHQWAGWQARAALQAAPVQAQEPVAWLCTDLDGHGDVGFTRDAAALRAGPSCNYFYQLFDNAAPAAQGDATDGAYEFAAKVIELFDDATMRADHMLDAGECASVIRALKSTEIAAIAAKAAS